MTDEFPVANPIKHGRNYFVRRLHYAAEEVRSYTLYFPLHRTPHGFLPFRSTPRQGKRFELLYGELPSGQVALEEFIPCLLYTSDAADD